MEVALQGYRCLCSRTFSSEEVFNRHYLRCQKRPRSRKKACEKCVRSKSRCDRAVPSCGRCVIKSLPCEYSHETWSTQGPSPLSFGHLSIGQSISGSVNTYRMSDEDLDSQFCRILPPSSTMHLDFPSGSEFASELNDTPTISQTCNETGGRSAATGSNMSNGTQLCKSPITTEDELRTIDDVFKQVFEGISSGKDRIPLIHFYHTKTTQSTNALSTVAGLSQLYVMRTIESEEVILDMVSQEVQQLYSQRTTMNQSDCLAAFQAVALYSAMRVYSKNHYVNDLVDTIAMTFTQYVLRHNMHCLQPETNVQPGDWSKWIQDESTRRTYFTLHALNVVSNSRKGFSTIMCQAFPEVPLPYPTHVWEASTSEAWAFHHQSWEKYCGVPLLGRDILHWADGKRTGREDQIKGWLTTIGTLGYSILACAKAQITASLAIRPD